MGNEKISLTPGNYNEWYRNVLIALDKKGLRDYLQLDSVPTDTERYPNASANFAKARGIILDGLDYGTIALTEADASPKAIIDKFKECFNISNIMSQGLIMRKMGALKGQVGQMDEYLKKMTGYFEELSAHGLNLPETYRCIAICVNMPEELDEVWRKCDDKGTMKLHDVKHQILATEARLTRNIKQADTVEQDESAFATYQRFNRNSNRPDNDNCFSCGGRGHFSYDCPTKQRRGRGRGRGRGDGWLIGHAFSAKQPGSDVWVVDSGATRFMCNNESSFSYMTMTASKVHTATNETTDAIGVGQVQIATDQGRRFPVNNVICAKELAANLLSVYQITRRGHSVTFKGDDCRIRDESGGLILTAKANADGLYVANLKVVKNKSFSAVTKSAEKINWHLRLCHASGGKLKEMSIDAPNGICKCCIISKSVKHIPRPITEIKTTRPLELVHCDLCDMPAVSIGKKRYMLTIVDDFSRYTNVYFLGRKNEATDKLISFCVYVGRQMSQYPLLAVRTDNGTEFVNQKLEKYFADHAIVHYKTAGYTSYQNGVVERKQETLQASMRAMLEQSGLATDMWAEAMANANHTWNRIITSSTGVTPIERWRGKAPDSGFLDHLRPFGCRCYVYNYRQQSKMDRRALEGVFLGYELTSKIYRILLDRGRKVIKMDASNVVFIEDEFPFHKRAPLQAPEPYSPPRTRSMGLPIVNAGHTDSEDSGEESDSEENRVVEEPDPDVDDSAYITQNNEPTLSNGADYEEEMEAAEADVSSMETDLSESCLKDEIEKHLVNDHEEVPLEDGLRKSNRVEKKFQIASIAAHNLELGLLPGECLPDEYKDLNWKAAMNKEYQNFLELGTFEWVEDDGSSIVDSKFVFDQKIDAAKNTQCKARLVARGFTQRRGIDFDETYANVAGQCSILTFLTKAAKDDLELYQIDVKSAFLNAALETPIRIRPPPGFRRPGLVWLAKKAIYGLKQASREWEKTLAHFMKSIGFEPLKADQCVYRNEDVFIIIYVDDILLAAPSMMDIKEIVGKIKERFQIHEIGEPRRFVGQNIQRDRERNLIYTSQSDYIDKCLLRFGLANCRGLDHLEKYLPIENNRSSPKKPIQEMLGCLQYLACKTRPDIVCITNRLSQEISEPTHHLRVSVVNVWRYLKKTRSLALTLGEVDPGTDDLVFSVDASFAMEKGSRSRSGLVAKLFGSTIFWKSQVQKLQAQSTADAELNALASACEEIEWIKPLVESFGYSTKVKEFSSWRRFVILL